MTTDKPCDLHPEGCNEVICGKCHRYKFKDGPCACLALSETHAELIARAARDGRAESADGKIIITIPTKDLPCPICGEALEAMTRERDAYRKAKQENDERFMNERDEARARVEELEKAIARPIADLAEERWRSDSTLHRVVAERDTARAEVARLREFPLLPRGEAGRYASIEDENLALRRELHSERARRMEFSDAASEQGTRAQALYEALYDFGRHSNACRLQSAHNTNCVCGLSKLLEKHK